MDSQNGTAKILVVDDVPENVRLLEAVLEANGYDIEYKDNIGPTETVYPLVKDGTIDLYAEYTGTFLTFLEGTPTADRDETYNALKDKLEGEGVVARTADDRIVPRARIDAERLGRGRSIQIEKVARELRRCVDVEARHRR